MGTKSTKGTFKIELLKEWYTMKETVEITGISDGTWHYRIKRNNIKGYKVERGWYYISKNEIIAEMNLQNFCYKEACTINEAMKIMNLSYLSIQTMIKHKLIVNYKMYGTKLFISNKDVENYLSNKEYLQNNFYTVKEIIQITKLSKTKIFKLIKEGKITGVQKHYIKGINTLFIPRHIINDYMSGKTTFGIIEYQEQVETLKQYNLNDYYTLKQSAEILGIAADTVGRLIREGKINAYKSNGNNVGSYYIISKNELNNIFNNVSIVKTITKKGNDWSRAFNMLTSALRYNTSHTNTCDLYKEWSLCKVNETTKKEIKPLVIRYISTLENLLKILNKEIYLYSDEEIIELINNKQLSNINLQFVPSFLEYCKNNVTTSYSNSYTTAIAKKKKTNPEDYRYNINEWVGFYKYLSNIHKHIFNAIDDYNYAQSWLYSVLHLSIAWRKTDMKKIPNVALELINIFSFEDVKNMNFTISKAQIVINNIKERAIGITANKTGARIHFIIPLDLTIPTALALVICEIHRRNQNENTLLNCKNFNLDTLFKDTNLPKFLNKKANTSLISYNFEHAVNKEGYSAIAYNLASLLRAHTTNIKTGYADTTTEYIYATNSDKSVENIPLHLFKRGFFGWQINMLLSIINENNIKYTIAEKTDIIRNINSEFSPMIIESIAEYLNIKHEESNELLQELLLSSKDEIISKLKEIIDGQSPALLDYAQCLKGIHRCIHSSKDSCFGCKYLIPTNYFLSLLKVEIYDLLDKLEKIEIYKKFEIQKYSFILKQLFFILMEAKIEFSRLDKDYINSFFNLKELKEKFVELEQMNKIIN